jgi:hypothetical protein
MAEILQVVDLEPLRKKVGETYQKFAKDLT